MLASTAKHGVPVTSAPTQWITLERRFEVVTTQLIGQATKTNTFFAEQLVWRSARTALIARTHTQRVFPLGL
jgi:hypothetical protein